MKKCRKCSGCGCPACLGTGSGYAKRIIHAWDRRGLTPEEISGLPVSEQRRVRNFIDIHRPLLELYDAKPGARAEEVEFTIEPATKLVPADQPRLQKVRFENGKIQIRVYYDYATEEIPVDFTHKDTRVLVGLHSNRLFMVEFKPTGDVGKDLLAVKRRVQTTMGWSPGTALNHAYALSNDHLIVKWFANLLGV